MKRKFSLPLLCFTMIGLVLPASAQDETPTDRLITDLGRYCNRATEVSYRSQSIVSSDTTKRVHIEGTLRKIIDPESPFRASADYCWASVTETLSAEVVVDGQTNTFALLNEPLGDRYFILNPISLSSDNRYLATEAHTVHGGLSYQGSVQFFDLERRKTVSSREICANEFNTEYDNISYEGFLTPTTAVVRCSIFDQTNDTRVERYELVDLTTGTSQVLSSKPDNLQDYSTVVTELEVTQVQEFEFE